MGVSENSVPLNPMVLLIIIPMKNGYFIGNIPNIFRQTQIGTLDPPDFETLIYQISPVLRPQSQGWQDITTQDRPLSLLLRLPHLSSCFYVCRSPKAEETCIDFYGSSWIIDWSAQYWPKNACFLSWALATRLRFEYIISVLRNMIQCPHAGEVP